MLRARLLSFILLMGLGAGSVSAQFFGKETFEVRSVDELLAAIGSDRTILLQPDALLISSDSLKKHQHVGRLGYAVFIHDVKNLRIAGAKSGASEITVNDLTLTFANCKNVELRDVKLRRSGTTPGAVLRFASSTNLLLRNCEVTDGTAVGIELKEVGRFELRNVTMRNCRPGMLHAEGSANLVFGHCRFENNGPQYGMRLANVYGVEFEECVFAENQLEDDFFNLAATGKISLLGGQWTGNRFQRLQTSGKPIQLKEVDGLEKKP